MKKLNCVIIVVLIFLIAPKAIGQTNYANNREPLLQKKYVELPLGTIKANGWLKEQLVRQKTGLTGKLDKVYPLVMGSRNGWLGGDGDQWERGPYWIDGLVPLAYILNDEELKAKAKPWIEWAIKSQRADGYFGPSSPATPYGPEPGLQRDNAEDWWPKMVMLKILQQHYSATGDKRVIDLLTKYFQYQLKELPKTPLGHWTFWGEQRGGDNLMTVYWLYNITGDKFLLELAELIHKQTFNWTDVFLNQDHLKRKGSLHCVNIAQGIKEPVIYYQQSKDNTFLKAVDKGFYDLMKFNGHPHGLYGSDEWLHGSDPTQGSELCTAVEMMFSLESMLPITANLNFADRLERVAFNALPTQATDDYMARQYFQQANQVMVNRTLRNFTETYDGTPTCFGTQTGYPCCTANMHQGWPKFVQNLWYATSDNGLAALVYSPSEVKAKVANGVEVSFTEETNYPFEESIRFVYDTDKKNKNVKFPFHLRVPGWCKKASVTINDKVYAEGKGNEVIIIDRVWTKGDKVVLTLPMHVHSSTWHENSVSVEHGPLVYALRIEEDWKTIKNEKDHDRYESYLEVLPKSPWNYALLHVEEKDLQNAFKVSRASINGSYPWNLENAPVTIKAKAKRMPQWKLYNDMAGPMIYSPNADVKTEIEEITLIPYGCSTLRISAFPTVR